MNNIQAMKTLIETQKNLISKNYNKYSENINLPQDTKAEIIRMLNEIELMLPASEPDKYPQEIQFTDFDFQIAQHTNGGKYLLMTNVVPDETIQCAIGFTTKKTKSSLDYSEHDFFLAETPIDFYAFRKNYDENNKDIDFYIFADLTKDNYTAKKHFKYDELAKFKKEEKQIG